MTIIDNAVMWTVTGPPTRKASRRRTFLLRQRQGMAWIGLYRPDAEELRSVAEEFDLSHLAVEDALAGHQRAKLEHYGETLFLVLRPARYLDDVEKVEFGEIHVFAGPDFVVTVRRAESPDLARVRRRMESEPEFLALGPDAVLYAILDQVVDEYEPVAAGLENDIDEIEDDLFAADPGGVPPDLRTLPPGHHVPAGDGPACRNPADPHGQRTGRRAGAGTAGPLPRRPGPRHPAGGAGVGLPGVAAKCAGRQRGPRGPAAERRNAAPDGIELRPERAGQADLVVGGHPVRADADRHRFTA